MRLAYSSLDVRPPCNKVAGKLLMPCARAAMQVLQDGGRCSVGGGKRAVGSSNHKDQAAAAAGCHFFCGNCDYLGK